VLLRIDPDPVGDTPSAGAGACAGADPGRVRLSAPQLQAAGHVLRECFTGVDLIIASPAPSEQGRKSLSDQCTQLPAVRSSRSYEADVELAALSGLETGR
jgi:hypothetical protein